MARKLKIGDAEYTVKVIPPYLLPYLNLYGDLATKKISTVEDAEEAMQGMSKASEKILSHCVTPKPPPEHEAEVFRFVSNVTNEAVRKIDEKFFPQRPDDSQGSGARAAPPRKAQ